MLDRAAEQPAEFIDAVGSARAQVKYLVAQIALGSRDESINDIGDKGEIAGLGTVTDDRERLARQFLSEENTEHRTVRSGRPRTRAVDVEKSQNGGREFP